MGPKDLAVLPDLDKGDFKVIGMYIQQFCFMDLNLRRALEIFHSAKMLPKEYQKLEEFGGEGGIRTPDTVTRMPHFECGAFNHSATSPWRRAGPRGPLSRARI
jgi:hypothetical protein